jgi:predicted small lipoprotein YifL
MMPRAACWALLACVLAAAACGQKGPLYLPDEDRPEQQERDGG